MHASGWWQRRPVAVIGAGVTGASWAGLFAAHGLSVRLWDGNEAALARALGRAREAARFLVAAGLADAAQAERGMTALAAAGDAAAALRDVALVQECVTEDVEIKRSVFACAGVHAPDDALLATSSSGLSISAIQTAAARPERCLAAHPYNPPHLVPLVELAPGASTAPGTLALAEAFYRFVGKEPVIVGRDLPGYVGNRLSAALWREAIDLVRTGVATVEDVDRVMTAGPGLRWAVMGPHLVYHLGGGPQGIRGHLAHLSGIKEGILADLATWTAFPEDSAAVLEEGVETEAGGRSLEELAGERDGRLATVLSALGKSAAAGPVPRAVAGATRAPDAVEVAPGVYRRTIAAVNSMMMVRFDVERGGNIPMHSHPHEQVGFLVHGRGVLVSESGERPVAAGDTWSMPGGVVHGARFDDSAAVVIEVFSPPREDYR